MLTEQHFAQQAKNTDTNYRGNIDAADRWDQLTQYKQQRLCGKSNQAIGKLFEGNLGIPCHHDTEYVHQDEQTQHNIKC